MEEQYENIVELACASAADKGRRHLLARPPLAHAARQRQGAACFLRIVLRSSLLQNIIHRVKNYIFSDQAVEQMMLDGSKRLRVVS